MTPLPCPCGRGMRAVLRDYGNNPVRLADVCKRCSGGVFGPPEPKPIDPAIQAKLDAIPLHLLEAYAARRQARKSPTTPSDHGAIVDPAELAAMPGSMLDAAKAHAADVLSLPASPPPRTLPVTPAERACATVLRAYLDYQPAPGDYDGERTVIRVIAGVECLLRDFGLVDAEETSVTPAGAALLARVEAAPVPDPMIAFEAAIRDAVAKGGPYGNTHAREAVASLDAARLSGTTPIDAPPAKEPR